MALSEQERTRICEEELIRSQMREEIASRRRRELIVMVVTWTIVLLGVVLAIPHLRF